MQKEMKEENILETLDPRIRHAYFSFRQGSKDLNKVVPLQFLSDFLNIKETYLVDSDFNKFLESVSKLNNSYYDYLKERML